MSKSTSKKVLKEKIVQLYELLFQKQDKTIYEEHFWDEFFLLKANNNALENELDSLKEDKLCDMKVIFNLLTSQCIVALKDQNQIRVANALFTQCTLIKFISTKSRNLPGKFDFIDIWIGRDNIEYKSNYLINLLCNILLNETPIGIKSLVLSEFLILVTAFDNINMNPSLEYLMSDQLFDALFHLLNVANLRQHLGYKIILLLTILVNYRKNESANPYIMKLSIVDDEIALSGYSQVLSNLLIDFNKNFDQINSESKSSGIFSTLTNMVGSIFIADENCTEKNNLKANNAVLLAFYEAVHLNRNFITLLTNSPTETYTLQLLDSNVINDDAIKNMQDPPSNLLVAFLEFCSIIMLQTKDEKQLQTTRLCFIILTCISEDQFANSLMHDENMAFRVHLHRMPMRHRKLMESRINASRPLSYAVFDLMVEFILTHMRKNLLLDLYLRSIGVIHRLLCYQKKCNIRVDYTWKQLWSALISLLKFIINNEADLVKKCNIFTLALQVVNIFNLFITFGDTFLPSPQTYDDLYYEIIRMHSIFDQLYSMTLRHVSNENSNHKQTAAKLNNSLVNIKAIISHFNAKIESWSSSNQNYSLTEEHVLEIVKNNYDSLTLKLQDNLDQFNRYDSEEINEANFFGNLLRCVITDYRNTNITLSMQDQQTLIHDLQSISNIIITNNQTTLET